MSMNVLFRHKNRFAFVHVFSAFWFFNRSCWRNRQIKDFWLIILHQTTIKLLHAF